MMTFISAWNNLVELCIYADFLLMEDYVQGALRKELLIASFVERFKYANLGNFY